MMTSNLPPGCSSADGGIDHAMEAALDTLCNAVSTPEMALTLAALAPALEIEMNKAARRGYDEGLMEPQHAHELG